MVVSLADLRFLLTILFFCGFGIGACSQEAPQVLGLRLEEPSAQVFMQKRVITAQSGASFQLRLFGSHLHNRTWPWVAFAYIAEGEAGAVGDAADPCKQESRRRSAAFQATTEFVADEESSGLITVQAVNNRTFPASGVGGDTNPGYHHVCILQGVVWVSVGPDKLRFVKDLGQPSDYIPAWGLAVSIILIIFGCAVFRSLNLSLLWLDPLELYVLHSCGSEKEKRAAKRLEPVRRRGNFLACALLFTCAVGHSALGVLFYRALGSVLPSVFLCGFLIFLLAELVPHVICSGYGFQLAPNMTWLAQVCMVLTCPLSCPLGLLLDLALRRDINTCSVREKTMEMIRTNVNDPYNEFVKEEFSRGALRTKTVEDILTPLKDCFMLPSTAVLDFGTMSEIMQSGYTRVPVYEEERSNIVEILYVKDLALVDPDDCTPMTTITKFYNHPLHFVFNDTKLDAMLEEFKKGNSHLAIVQKVNNEGEGDPFYEVLGLVTLEDVIEEIIKSEILDESDGYMETKVKRPLAPLEIPLEPRPVNEEFSLFKLPDGEPKIRTSPQLLLATHRFLSRGHVNQEVKFDPGNRLSPDHYLYTRNHPVDYFILLLQGRVEVEIGKEGLKFENGAFTYYGVSALTAPSSAQGTPVMVTRLQYLNALMASRVAQSPDPPEIKILPNSQTKLLNERNTNPGGSKSKENVEGDETQG
ncbi:hypothetical protein JZ751_011650 [Albula glossodonta]|uniref:Metal transporter n=1 Tax=Albula glossodonta TaxID=121402 RepID=A0A8T2PQB1_9TELE|nr:hypothetical protein JZ751_011650 [Albula glossodonta]